jgi:hypothetical protein
MKEIIDEITKILDYLKRKEVYGGYDGDTLTSGGIKLSLLKVTLGDMIADLEMQADLLEVQFGLDEANAYLKIRNESKMSIDDTKQTIKKDLAGAKTELVTMQANVRKLKVYHKNITDVMTNIQTRVSYLRHERNEQQLNKG